MRVRDAERNGMIAESGAMPRDNRRRGWHGQSMVEYVLIAALVAIAIGAAIELTGPAIGNIFSNTVYGVLGQTTTPYKTLSNNQISTYQGAVASFTYATYPFTTNTPAAATCKPPAPSGQWVTIGPTDQWPPTYAVTC